MGLLRKRSNYKRTMEDANVNITALLDVLSVLLFFLVKSFTVSASLLTPPKGVRLPASFSQTQADETVTIAISKDFLYANNIPLMKLRRLHFKKSEIGEDERTLLPLKSFLDVENEKRLAIFQGIDAASIPPGRVLIQGDQKIPFGVMKYILHTSTVSGYSNYDFVVSNDEEN